MEAGYALLNFPWGNCRRRSFQGVISNYEQGWVKVLKERWPCSDDAERYAWRVIRRARKFYNIS